METSVNDKEAQQALARHNSDPIIRQFLDQLYEIFVAHYTIVQLKVGGHQEVMNAMGTVLYDEKLKELRIYRAAHYPLLIHFNR